MTQNTQIERLTRIGRGTGEIVWGAASTGAMQIGALFELLDGPHVGKHATAYFNLGTHKAIEFSKKQLRACGCKVENTDDWSTIGAQIKAAARVVELVFERDMGRPNPEWKLAVVQQPGVAMKHALDAKQTAAVIAALGKGRLPPSFEPSEDGDEQAAPSFP